MSASEMEPEKADAESPSQRSAKRKAHVDEIEVDLAAPEPPSKKARRALKKGKPVPAKRGSDDDKDDLEDEDGGAEGDAKKGKKEKPRSEHGVWIGNLPFYLTAQDLRKWLVDNAGGVIQADSITRVKLPTSKDKSSRDKKEKPANKGFAYVDFADLSTKVAAIALSENDLGGRKLLIKDSKSFEGRPAKEDSDKKKEGEASAGGDKSSSLSKTEQRQENNASRKVFVGNLSFKTTQEDLTRNFEKCGEIEWAKLATFEDSGKCKGFGWVKFKEPEAAAWAVKGFVKIKEAVETEEDFKDDSDDEEGDENDDDGDKADKGEKSKQEKKFKMRKWWVNRLFGRELKLELAEDDQSRYKKRFGKDAKRAASLADGKTSTAVDGEGSDQTKRKNNDHEAEEKKRRRPEPAAMKTSSQDINVARLTGAVVAHTGTKVTFD